MTNNSRTASGFLSLIKEKISSVCNPNKVHVFNDTCMLEEAFPAVRVYVVFPQVKTITVTVQYTTDIYDIIRYHMLKHNVAQTVDQSIRFAHHVNLYYKGKPLSHKHTPLYLYNIHNGDSIFVMNEALLGGCDKPVQIIQTNWMIKTCEHQLIKELSKKNVLSSEFKVQSNVFSGLFTEQIKKFLINQNFDYNYILKLLEDVNLFISMLVTSSSKTQYWNAIVAFLKLRTDEALFTSANVDKFVNFFKDLFKEEYQVQSFDFFSDVKGYLGKYEELKRAPIFKKLYKLAMYALSYSIFSKIGLTFSLFNFSEMEAEAIKRGCTMGPDFLHTLLTTLIFICETGYQCVKTGSLDPLYHSGNSYEKWYNKAMELKNNSILLNNPEAHGFKAFEFLADLNDCIDQGEAIHKHATRVGDYEKRMVASVLSDLKLIKANLTTKREAQKERTAPFTVCLYGGSSIGKTTITDMLFYQYGKVFDLPLGSEFKYTRNPNAKYWDGFNSSQWFVIMDDIAYMHPNVAAQGDPSVMETIQTNNRVAFVPDQAALDDKGRTPFKARCVVATTNCESLNAVHYFQTPLAMQRRFPFVIDVTVKPEFAKDNCMLDSKSAKHIDGEWPNFWKFIIKRPVPVGEERYGQRAQLEKIHEFDETDDFLAWFAKEAIEHERVQKLVERSTNHMRDLTLCSKCFRLEHKCKCDEFQVQANTSWTFKDIIKYYSFHGALNVIKSRGFGSVVDMAVNQPFLVERLERAILTNPDVLNNENIAEEEFSDVSGTSPEYDSYFTRFKQIAHDSSMSMKEKFFILGEKVKSMIGDHPIIALTLMGVSAILSVYALIKNFTSDFTFAEEGNVSSKDFGGEPTPSNDEKPNVWFRDDYELSSFDIKPLAGSWNSLERQALIDKLSVNVVNIVAKRSVDGGFMFQQGQALCIGGHIYVTNNHNMSDECDTIELKITTNKVVEGVCEQITTLINQTDIIRFIDQDVCSFRLRCMPPRKDISELFVSKNNRAIMKGVMITRSNDGIIATKDLHNIKKTQNMQVANVKFTTGWLSFVDEPTTYGDCGAIHVALSALGPQILGLHALGDGATRVVSTNLTYEMVNDIIKSYDQPIISSGEPMLSSESAPHELGPLHAKSPLRYIPAGVAAVYGSYLGFRSRPKSRVSASILQQSMIEEGYEVKHGAPVMVGYTPWRTAALDMVNPVTKMDISVLNECKKSFIADIFKGLSKDALKEVMIYNDLVTMNGAPGVAFVDKMNRNTSCGAPWRKGKKHFLIELPATDAYPDAVMFNDEVMSRVNTIIAKYKNGERAMPVFTGQLKDEALAFRKIVAGKTRVFAGAPADWSFVVRKYLLSVIRLIQTNKFVFETGVGTNACSTQWQEIRDYLTVFGDDRMIAGDYGSFDKTMPPDVILAAYDIIYAICKEAGYSESDLLVVQGIAEDTAFPLVDFNGDLVQFYGSNPSGHPLTVIINSLANSLYMRYCYTIMSPDKSCVNFKKHVNLMTYGDDNVMGVSDDAPFFNHTAIQDALASAGIKYTMADKEAESIPYININDVSFLKRFWRWDEDCGAYLAPLEESSIVKSLTVTVASKTICPEAQAVATMSSAHCEYFFHGKEKFLEKSAMFQRLVAKNKLEYYLEDNTFPTYEQLRERFWRNSQ